MRRFPLDEIKIDRPFVGAMLVERGDAALVRSAIDLGHHFGLRVVAEGVESEAIAAELRRLGCDVAQGNAVSAPLTAGQLRDWWAKHAGGT
jgi:EAL domain-containing protein (putative c-di-GMP-specific phosphodiesterase class I)